MPKTKKKKKTFLQWLWIRFYTILAPVLLVIFLDATGRLNWLYAMWSGIDKLPVVNEMKDDFLTGAKLYGQEYGPVVRAFYASVSEKVTTVHVTKNRRYWNEEEIKQDLAARLPRSKQGNMQAYCDYVGKYREYAILEMRRTGIPASIILAQGLLESDADRSRLAQVAKNHFGIKCRTRDGFKRDGIIDDEDFIPHSMCVGCLQANDDYAWDRFEIYDSVADSYRRHSILLKQSRYNWMIRSYPIGGMYTIPREIYGKTVVPYYAAWAVGLKSSGYATCRSYAEKITLIIEYYKLYLVDYEGLQV